MRTQKEGKQKGDAYPLFVWKQYERRYVNEVVRMNFMQSGDGLIISYSGKKIHWQIAMKKAMCSYIGCIA